MPTSVSHITDEMRHLRSDDLFGLARNPAAQQRQEAIRILVERGSPHCGHPDIAAEAAGLVHGDPSVLKTTDPSVHLAGRLPGVLDVLARTVERAGALENSTIAIQSDIVRHADSMKETEARLLTGITESSRKLATAVAAEISALDRRVAQLTQLHDQRLRLLERSLWQKIKDKLRTWFKRS